jgi:hypothetical protein
MVKLDSLSEDQIALLLYCINDGRLNKQKDYFYEDLKFINPMRAFEKLNEYAPKIKPEYQPMMQDIVNKVINKEIEVVF